MPDSIFIWTAAALYTAQGAWSAYLGNWSIVPLMAAYTAANLALIWQMKL